MYVCDEEETITETGRRGLHRRSSTASGEKEEKVVFLVVKKRSSSTKLEILGGYHRVSVPAPWAMQEAEDIIHPVQPATFFLVYLTLLCLRGGIVRLLLEFLFGVGDIVPCLSSSGDAQVETSHDGALGVGVNGVTAGFLDLGAVNAEEVLLDGEAEADRSEGHLLRLLNDLSWWLGDHGELLVDLHEGLVTELVGSLDVRVYIFVRAGDEGEDVFGDPLVQGVANLKRLLAQGVGLN